LRTEEKTKTSKGKTYFRGHIPSLAAKKFLAYYATIMITAVFIKARHKTLGYGMKLNFT
jgi:hypothetical protein